MTLHRRALLVLALFFATGIASADDITTSGGKKITGKLVAVDAQGVTFSGGEAQARIAGKDIVVVDFHHAVSPVPKDKETGRDPRIIQVDLIDGSTLRAAKFVLKGKKIEAELFPVPAGVAPPVLDLPMTAMFSVDRNAGDPKNREAWKKVLAARGKRDLYLIREGDTLNFVQGTILGGNEKGDEIDFEKEDGSKAQLRQSRAAGYVFAQPAKDLPQMLCKVFDVFGNALVAQSVDVTSSGIAVTTVSGVVVKYSSTAALSKFDYSQGNIAYLSDLDPRVDAPEPPMDEKGLRLNADAACLRDRGLAGEPLKLGAEVFTKGLLVAPDTMLTYTIGGDYREFKTVIGIPDTTPDANLEAKVTIEADGRTLYSGTIKRKDKPKGISLDVKGVKSLRLIVEADFAVNGNRVIFGAAVVQK
jgi:hypothetical protein